MSWLTDSGGGVLPNWVYVTAGVVLVAGVIWAWGG